MSGCQSVTIKQERKEIFSCTCCCQLLSPPIFTCPQDHPFCSSCRGFFRKCTLCQEELMDSPCEQWFIKWLTLPLPCKYKDNGCDELLALPRRQLHEERCSMQPLRCPFLGCPSGLGHSPEDIAAHLRIFHAQTLEPSNHSLVPLRLRLVQSNAESGATVSAFGKVFQVDCFVDDGVIVCLAFLLGNRGESAAFKVDVSVHGNCPYPRISCRNCSVMSILDRDRALRWKTATCRFPSLVNIPLEEELVVEFSLSKI